MAVRIRSARVASDRAAFAIRRCVDPDAASIQNVMEGFILLARCGLVSSATPSRQNPLRSQRRLDRKPLRCRCHPAAFVPDVIAPHSPSPSIAFRKLPKPDAIGKNHRRSLALDGGSVVCSRIYNVRRHDRVHPLVVASRGGASDSDA